MGKDFDPHYYYAAGILWFCENSDESEISISKLMDWSDYLGDDGWGNANTEKLLVNENLIEQALFLLEKEKTIERFSDQFGPEIIKLDIFYSLSDLASKFQNSPFDRTFQHKEKWIKEALKKINSQDGVSEEKFAETDLKQSSLEDDKWEPLQIDRSTPEYEETIAGIEKAIQEIAADNGFSNTFPDERDNIVKHAKTTIESVKDGKATKGQIKQNLIAAGKWVMQKFTGSALGAAGKALLDWGLKLFI